MPLKRTGKRTTKRAPKRFTKRTTKRATVKRRGGSRRGYTQLPLTVRNQRGYVKLTYSQAVTLSTSVAYSAENAFRTNSIFDPDYTGTGHQPYMHDQLSALWTKYRVMGCKVSVTFHPTTANYGATLYIRAGDGVTVSTANTSAYLRESKQCNKIRDIRPYVSASGVAPQLTLSTYIRNKTYEHNPDQDSYMAAFGANPSDSIFVIVGHCSDATTSVSFVAHVTITYYCVLTGPVLQTAS